MTVRNRSGEWVAGELAGLLGVPLATFELGHGGNGYRQGLRGPVGAAVLFDNVYTAAAGYATFDLPGQALATVSDGDLQAMLRRWQDDGVEMVFRRSDLAADGLGATVDEVERRYREHGDEVRCRAERSSWKSHSSAKGRTFAIGSRSSERYARIYDMHGPVRVELECKGRAAVAVGALLLLGTPWQEWPTAILGVIADFIDFGTDWWATFVQGVARARLVMARAATVTVERARDWLERQVAPTLAFVVAAMGGDLGYAADLVSNGRRRLRGSRLALVAA